MALFTPRTGPRMEHTPRMSERKRGLFQPSPEHFLRSSKTKEQQFQEESEDSEDSCDLGILSPLASGSSSDDYDQSVPQTPNSWRVSKHSTSFDSQRKRSSRIVRNIINSPLTFKNYTTRRSKNDIESPKPGSNRQSIMSIEIDAESCSNSLQDLTFHSDNDLSDTKENTPRKNTHYLRKSVRHRYKPAKLMDDDTSLKNPNRKALSPIKNSQITLTHKLIKAEIHSQSFVLKTPDDAMQICKDTPPRVNHRRSMHNMITDDSINYAQNDLKRRQRPDDSDSRNTSPRQKFPRLENAPAPKARLSLFGNGDTKHYFSPKSFYPKSNDNLNKSFVSKASPVEDISKTVKPRRHSSGISQRKVFRKRLGDINKGVRHGIRRPKPSKNKPITKSDALKLALNILENSPLNDYINEFMTKQKSTVKISNLDNNSVEDQVISNTDIANATGLSHVQINKMDEILKQVGCKESINKVLGSKTNFKDLLVDTDTSFKPSITAAEDMFDNSEETPDSTAGNKFFKNSKAAAFRKATVKLSNNLRLHVKDGKACLPEKKQKDLDGASIQRKLAMLQVISQFDTSDLMQEDDFIDDEKKAINDLLLQWSEEEVPSTEPQAKQNPANVSKSIEEAKCLLNFNTGRSLPVEFIDDETVSSVTHDKKQLLKPWDNIQDTNLESSQLNQAIDSEIIVSDPATSFLPNNNSVPNSSVEVDQLSNSSDSCESVGFTRGNNAIQFLPVDGGCIIVDAEMPDESDMPCDLDKIESELEYLDNQISKMAKMNNINPDLLLLPNITQMYSTAPDSILSGPPTESTVSWASASQSGFEVETSIHQNESQLENSTTVESSTKLFPLFVKDSTNKKQTVRQENNKSMTPTTKSKKLCTDKKQYLIDAGQKKLGATQCAECGVIYQDSDAQDKQDHLTHHMALDVLKFNGWKNERLCGRWGEGRAIVVQPGDSAFHWQRVHSLLERVVHPQLGFAVNLDPKKFYKVYLYIEGKQIVGCLVAETLQKAYRLLPGKDIDCCSVESYPVKCGISRIWTHMSFQRRGIATNLVNSMRANFFFGHILACDEIAFSSPTSAGKSFAERYTRTPNFYVYID